MGEIDSDSEFEKHKNEVLDSFIESLTNRSGDMELLTTGQMLDKIKTGEIAETRDGYKVIKRPGGEVTWHHNGDEPKNYLTVNRVALDFKWRILPNYVSFEDAMKALKDGKKVTFHAGEEKYQITSGWCLVNDWVNQFNWNDLMENTWTIEE